VVDIDFLVDFVAENSKKLQKLDWEGKISFKVCSHFERIIAFQL
jgi:hypothetical protein